MLIGIGVLIGLAFAALVVAGVFVWFMCGLWNR